MTPDEIKAVTPDKAREIVVDWADCERRFPSPALHAQTSAFERDIAKGFLQGVAYQEEKAKGLVEALEKIAEYGHRDGLYCPNFCKDALAHYRQGQEKP